MKNIEITEENRFDLYEAMHCYATLWHDGQSSVLYSILSQSEFHPGPFWSAGRVMHENPYYDMLNTEICIDVARQFGMILE